MEHIDVDIQDAGFLKIGYIDENSTLGEKRFVIVIQILVLGSKCIYYIGG